MIDLVLPVATVSEANSHEHWRARQRRAKAQRQQVALAVRAAAARAGAQLCMPLRVTFTRFSPRELDTDNLQGAFKHVRDGVADAVGVDDRDKRYAWSYAQQRAKSKGIRIVVEQVTE